MCVIRQLEFICYITIYTTRISYCTMHISFKSLFINLHNVFIATGHHKADVYRSAVGTAKIPKAC